MPEFQPNEWGVTFAVTRDAIWRDLERWDWGGRTEPKQVALLVLDGIREQTMASIEDDGDTVELGLFEFEMPLRISLTHLVDTWVEHRTNVDTGRLSDDQRPIAIAMAEQIATCAATLRKAGLDHAADRESLD